MSYEYIIYNKLPEKNILSSIVELHKDIFNTNEDLIRKMACKPKLLVIAAYDHKKIIGYKIGYEIDNSIFYSWLGGVNPNYRNLGIASKLMDIQHQYLKKNGYDVVQTKTMNRWRNMLILNIKMGFNVIAAYTDEKELHKIVLEKEL